MTPPFTKPCRYRPPSSSEPMILTDLLDFNLRRNPDHLAVIHPSYDKERDSILSKRITFRRFQRAVEDFAEKFRDLLPASGGEGGEVPKSTTIVSLLANSSILYEVTRIALVKMGMIVLCLSPRNSNAVSASLMAKVGSLILFHDDDNDDVQNEEYANVLGEGFKTFRMPSFDQLFPDLKSEEEEEEEEEEVKLASSTHSPDPRTEKSYDDEDRGDVEKRYRENWSSLCDRPVYILQTSGTTSGNPKPIYHTNRYLWYLAILNQGPSCSAGDKIFVPLPLNHILAMGLYFLNSLTTGSVGIEMPREMTAQTDHFVKMIRHFRPQTLVSVPMILESIWNTDRELGIRKILVESKRIGFGGSALNPKIRDEMVKEKVPLLIGYGTTEIGNVTYIHPSGNPLESEYMRWREDEMEYLMTPQGQGLYEFILLSPRLGSRGAKPAKLDQGNEEMISDGEARGRYSTGDLFVEHPTEKGWWKIVGRKDDLIVHRNGEKTDPRPLEAHLESTLEFVKKVLVGGQGKDQVFALVEFHQPALREQGGGEVEDEEERRRRKAEVRKSLEAWNQKVPKFSKLYPEMVIFCERGRSLPLTAKGSVQKVKALEMYEREIESLYRLSSSSSDGRERNEEEDLQSLEARGRGKDPRSKVESILASVLGRIPENEEEDFVSRGLCDSLQALMIWSRFVSSLSSERGGRRKEWERLVNKNLVYLKPSLASLTRFYREILESEGEVLRGFETLKLSEEQVERKAEEMERLRDRLCLGLSGPDHPQVDSASPEKRGISSDSQNHLPPPTCGTPRWTRSRGGRDGGGGVVVLLTGSTGQLGCHLLSQLLSSDRVIHIYCLNRRRRKDVMLDHQRRAMTQQAIPVQLLDRNISRLSLIGADLGEAHLGVGQELYQELLEEVDLVIHNAWPVNFNMGLSSFVETHIQGTRNLLDFCSLSDKMRGSDRGRCRFGLVSSIASSQRRYSYRPWPVEESMDVEAREAVGVGYGESKWVAEQIVSKYAESWSFSSSQGGEREAEKRCFVLRVGQLCGGSDKGGWSPLEWLPLLVSMVGLVGCAPDRLPVKRFLPASLAAKATLELLLGRQACGREDGTQEGEEVEEKEEEKEGVVIVRHIINPCESDWKGEMLGSISKYFEQRTDGGRGARTKRIETVDCETWLEKVKRMASAPSNSTEAGDEKEEEQEDERKETSPAHLVERVPGFKLASFFELGLEHADVEFELAKSVRDCPSLSKAVGLSGEVMTVHLKDWEEKGLF
ncbi:acetyl-CoA synthetase-like protein [Violaceomyces palustris]|uniref:Acetyl-CoA synthetase-like protein n=1 Tax=Violaceomyces palustris TaxID=1673888 RepID=A0ACD0NYZ9_9BASI|nr:acetyl-CoA synthetase-like protein [Violaceomyces palustris]